MKISGTSLIIGVLGVGLGFVLGTQYSSPQMKGEGEGSRSSGGRVYLNGNIAKVGPLDLPAEGGLTVSKAILSVGGFGDFANQRQVTLIREKPAGDCAGGEKEKIVVDCKKIFQGEADAIDPVLVANDLIVVPARVVNF